MADLLKALLDATVLADGPDLERHVDNIRTIARNLRGSDQSKIIQRVRDHWADLLDQAADTIDGH